MCSFDVKKSLGLFKIRLLPEGHKRCVLFGKALGLCYFFSYALLIFVFFKYQGCKPIRVKQLCFSNAVERFCTSTLRLWALYGHSPYDQGHVKAGESSISQMEVPDQACLKCAHKFSQTGKQIIWNHACLNNKPWTQNFSRMRLRKGGTCHVYDSQLCSDAIYARSAKMAVENK